MVDVSMQAMMATGKLTKNALDVFLELLKNSVKKLEAAGNNVAARALAEYLSNNGAISVVSAQYPDERFCSELEKRCAEEGIAFIKTGKQGMYVVADFQKETITAIEETILTEHNYFQSAPMIALDRLQQKGLQIEDVDYYEFEVLKNKLNSRQKLITVYEEEDKSQLSSLTITDEECKKNRVLKELGAVADHAMYKKNIAFNEKTMFASVDEKDRMKGTLYLNFLKDKNGRFKNNDVCSAILETSLSLAGTRGEQKRRELNMDLALDIQIDRFISDAKKVDLSHYSEEQSRCRYITGESGGNGKYYLEFRLDRMVVHSIGPVNDPNEIRVMNYDDAGFLAFKQKWLDKLENKVICPNQNYCKMYLDDAKKFWNVVDTAADEKEFRLTKEFRRPERSEEQKLLASATTAYSHLIMNCIKEQRLAQLEAKKNDPAFTASYLADPTAFNVSGFARDVNVINEYMLAVLTEKDGTKLEEARQNLRDVFSIDKSLKDMNPVFQNAQMHSLEDGLVQKTPVMINYHDRHLDRTVRLPIDKYIEQMAKNIIGRRAHEAKELNMDNIQDPWYEEKFKAQFTDIISEIVSNKEQINGTLNKYMTAYTREPQKLDRDREKAEHDRVFGLHPDITPVEAVPAAKRDEGAR